MPKSTEVPDALKVFAAHGVELTRVGSTDQVGGECPFCASDKFMVRAAGDKAGCWDCKVCGKSGNAQTFLRQFWEEACVSPEAAGPEASERFGELRENRGLLSVETLNQWGVRLNPLTGEFVVPAYGHGGKLDQLYRYVALPSGKHALIASPGFGHGLFGVPLLREGRAGIDVYEGPWDAMAAWECLSSVKRTAEGLDETGSEAASLLGEVSVNVLAVPGANVFLESWLPVFEGKAVRLFYDNDHPRNHPKTGAVVDGAGLAGTRRACQLMALDSRAPATLHYLRWGTSTHHDPELASGYDVRDYLSQETTAAGRAESWLSLVTKLAPLPNEWVSGRQAPAVRRGGTELEALPCESWKDQELKFKHYLKWIPGLRAALAVGQAAILSTPTVGEQLWVRFIGPPSCGKTEICEALSTNKKYVKAVSKFKGFHSGYVSEKGGRTDYSLIRQLQNMTMIMKDGDTFLQLPNLPEVMSEMRDAYDRASRAVFKTGIKRDQEGVNLTVIIAGTESLRRMDASELGERFIDVVVVDKIDVELERDISVRSGYQEWANCEIVADGKLETRAGPEKVEAYRTCMGYINFLRTKGTDLVRAVRQVDGVIETCHDLALFVAHCRCRQSKTQDEKIQREMCPRLTKQFVRLARNLAVVLNREEPDDDVMALVRKVALDTARGKTLDIVAAIHAAGSDGLDATELSIATLRPEDKEKQYLQFLRNKDVKVVQTFRRVGAGGKGPVRWRLHPDFARIYRAVVGGSIP